MLPRTPSNGNRTGIVPIISCWRPRGLMHTRRRPPLEAIQTIRMNRVLPRRRRRRDGPFFGRHRRHRRRSIDTLVPASPQPKPTGISKPLKPFVREAMIVAVSFMYCTKLVCPPRRQILLLLLLLLSASFASSFSVDGSSYDAFFLLSKVACTFGGDVRCSSSSRRRFRVFLFPQQRFLVDVRDHVVRLFLLVVVVFHRDDIDAIRICQIHFFFFFFFFFEKRR